MTSEIQSVLFRKENWTLEKAKKWLLFHKLRPIKNAHMTDNFIRFRLENPSKYRRFKTKIIPVGIELVIGYF